MLDLFIPLVYDYGVSLRMDDFDITFNLHKRMVCFFSNFFHGE